MGQPAGESDMWIGVRTQDATISPEQYRALGKCGLYIILDNLRSAFNVGSIFRLSDTLRVSGLFLCGYTAFPPHVKLEKTSLGTIDYVPWRHFETTLEALVWCKEQGISVWAAETTSCSQPYAALEYPNPLAVVFGNEALGVSPEILQCCEKVIEIPVHGFKNSLNVATSCAVIGYRYLEKSGFVGE